MNPKKELLWSLWVLMTHVKGLGFGVWPMQKYLLLYLPNPIILQEALDKNTFKQRALTDFFGTLNKTTSGLWLGAKGTLTPWIPNHKPSQP